MALSLEKQVIFPLRLSVPYGAVASGGSTRAYFRHTATTGGTVFTGGSWGQGVQQEWPSQARHPEELSTQSIPKSRTGQAEPSLASKPGSASAPPCPPAPSCPVPALPAPTPHPTPSFAFQEKKKKCFCWIRKAPGKGVQGASAEVGQLGGWKRQREGRGVLGEGGTQPRAPPCDPGPGDLLAGALWSSLTHRVTPDAWGWGGGC